MNERKLWKVSALMKQLCCSYLSKREDVKVVMSAMLHRCSAQRAYLSTKVGVYFTLRLRHMTNG